MKALTTTLYFGIAFTLLTAPALAQDAEKPRRASMQGHVFMPGRVDATDERVKQLKVPAGFQITKFAEGLNKPRTIAVHTDGSVYVTDRDKGVVTMLRDTNNDGKADEKREVASREGMHGVAIRNNQIYLATVKELYTAPINKDGTLGELKMLIDDLPDGGQHPNRTLKFDDNGMLYISIGSSCNACDETNEEHATLLQAKADGSDRKIYAKGLRNTFGFDWHPETKEMWGMDHGIDWLGDDSQREELNKIEEGAHYGWPFIYEDGKEHPARIPDEGHEEFKKKTKYPALTYTAHASGMGMVFYTGQQFPQEYRNDAFVAFRGSWNRSEPAGYKIARIRFENGEPKAFEDFVTGFLVNNNENHFGRIVGMAVHRDGSLLFTDDSNGVVYRVAYTGGQQQQQRRRR